MTQLRDDIESIRRSADALLWHKDRAAIDRILAIVDPLADLTPEQARYAAGHHAELASHDEAEADDLAATASQLQFSDRLANKYRASADETRSQAVLHRAAEAMFVILGGGE